MNTEGFYKLDTDLLYAPNFVYGGYDAYQLLKENKETYTYPVDGWYWFNTEEEAKTFFNLNEVTNV